MDSLSDSFIVDDNTKKYINNYCNKKCAMCFSFLCFSATIAGLIYFNDKCGSFTTDVSICDIPNYCPNKDLCDESDGSI